jgi:hypothetical protein
MLRIECEEYTVLFRTNYFSTESDWQFTLGNSNFPAERGLMPLA